MSTGGRDVGTDADGTVGSADSAPVRGDLGVLEAAFAGLAEGVTVHDATGKILLCNPAAAGVFGLTADEVLGASATSPALEVSFEDGVPLTAANSLVARVLATNRVERGVIVQFPHPRTGARRWLEGSVAPLSSEGAERPWGVVCSWVDITAREEAESTLREFSRQARTVLGSDSMLVFVKDRAGRYMFVNEPLAARLGASQAEVVGRSDSELLPPELVEECVMSHRRALEERTVVETEETFDGPDGPVVYLTLKFPLLNDADEPHAVVGLMTDITERVRVETALREREEKLTSLAFHDPLTGLANRWLLEERLSAALARARTLGTAVGVLLLDVNNLKQINDAHGHAAGDVFLCEIARRIEQAMDGHRTGAEVPAGATMVVRHGGDEFVAVVADIDGAPQAILDVFQGRIEAALREPFEVTGERLEASVSIGGAVFPQDGEDAESLLAHADAAMYRMKRTDRRGSRERLRRRGPGRL